MVVLFLTFILETPSVELHEAVSMFAVPFFYLSRNVFTKWHLAVDVDWEKRECVHQLYYDDTENLPKGEINQRSTPKLHVITKPCNHQ